MNNGVNRTTRENEALNPSFIAIDERSVEDKMLFSLAFAKDISYYNFNNAKEGNWEAFFERDPAFAIIKLIDTDVSGFKSKIQHIIQTEFDDDVAKNKLAHQILQMKQTVEKWEDSLKKSAYSGVLINEIITLQESLFQHILPIISSIDKYIPQSHEEHTLKLWTSSLLLKRGGKDRRLAQGRTNEGKETKEALINTSDQMYGKLIFLQERATKELKDALYKNNTHLPHIGMLFTFFELSKHFQKDMQELTKRHLEHYFQKHLKQENRGEVIVKALVKLDLVKASENLVIQKNEKFRLSWGSGNEYECLTTSVNHISAAEVCDIKTLYNGEEVLIGKSKTEIFDIPTIPYQSERIQDQLVEDTLADAPLTFGDRNNKMSDLGFVVSSPALILEPGNQEITVSFRINAPEYETNDDAKSRKAFSVCFKEYFKKVFDIYITDIEGWKKINIVRIRLIDNILHFSISIDSKKYHLTTFDALIHEGTYTSEWPCLKIVLNNYNQIHPYRFFKDVTVEDITIKASVSGVHKNILSNVTGEVDSTIPFSPFGSLPAVGSFLRIENPLVLQRYLNKLDIDIFWSGLPLEIYNGLKPHYSRYPGAIKSSSFKAVLTQDRTNVHKYDPNKKQRVQLFQEEYGYLNRESKISVDVKEFPFVNRIFSDSETTKVNNPLYLVLSEPAIAFGHQIFPEIYAENALLASRYKRRKIELPKAPYTPIMEKLVLNYENIAKENLRRKQDITNTDLAFIHLYPFGHVDVFPGSIRTATYLLPQINYKGNLFIGLKNINPLETLNIGFDLIAATYVHTAIKKPDLEWQYLVYNEWKSLGDHLLEDGTKGLTTSGVVKFRIPEIVQYTNSRLPQGQFWIRASYNDPEDINSRVRRIFAQAVEIKGVLEGYDPTQQIKSKINVEIINTVVAKNINRISEPFDFVMENNTQTTKTFNTAVSEQLRHKNRAVTNWDFERLVLDKFSTIDNVRVYGRSNHPKELLIGNHIQIVLIPKVAQGDANGLTGVTVDRATLVAVKKYVASFLSPHVQVDVSNALYERIKVRCRVKFNTPENSGYLRDILNEELVNFLSPFMDSPLVVKGFDKAISKTEILIFIESREYVELVSDFTVLQLVEVEGKHRIIDTNRPSAQDKEIEDLVPITPYVILSSVAQHHIEIIKEDGTLDHSVIDGLDYVALGTDYILIENNVYN